MSGKPVHLAVYDTFADWETGFATAYLARGGHPIRTVGASAETPAVSVGGLRVLPDLALDDIRPEDSSLLILPGADLWDTTDDLAPFARKAREFLAAGTPSPRSAEPPPGSPARVCSTSATTRARSPSIWPPPATAAATGTPRRTR